MPSGKHEFPVFRPPEPLPAPHQPSQLRSQPARGPLWLLSVAVVMSTFGVVLTFWLGTSGPPDVVGLSDILASSVIFGVPYFGATVSHRGRAAALRGALALTAVCFALRLGQMFLKSSQPDLFTPASLISCGMLGAVAYFALGRTKSALACGAMAGCLAGLGIWTFAVHVGATPRLDRAFYPYHAGVMLALVVYGPVMGVTLALPGIWLYRHPSVPHDEAPHCGKCGYDLTGNVSGTCPECGQRIEQGS